MSSYADVRRLALALPGVTERTAYGMPALYAGKSLFVRLRDADPEVIVCWRASVEAREELIAAEPDTYFTTEHYRGHASVLVRLAAIDVDELNEVLLEAWEARAPARLRKARAQGDADA